MNMSFVGCVGVLTSNNGLVDVMQSAFGGGGVAHMLTGKAYLKMVMLLVCKEIIYSVMKHVNASVELMSFLDDIMIEVGRARC